MGDVVKYTFGQRFKMQPAVATQPLVFVVDGKICFVQPGTPLDVPVADGAPFIVKTEDK